MKAPTVWLVGASLGMVVLLACSPQAAKSAVPGGEPGPPAPSSTTTTFAPHDRRVFVEGDSLTLGIAPYLPVLLAPADWAVTLDDAVGRDTATGIASLMARQAEIGGTLVVALGTNDAPDPTLFATRIARVMQVAAGRQVIWVTVARAGGWNALDDALFAAQVTWPNLRVIDWRPIIASNPALLAGDGIHLTDAGYLLRAEFLAAAIEATG